MVAKNLQHIVVLCIVVVAAVVLYFYWQGEAQAPIADVSESGVATTTQIDTPALDLDVDPVDANSDSAQIPPTSHLCTDDEKLRQACTREYAPVCGLVEVQCITAPCPPIPETFSNACVACSQGNVLSYTSGACLADT